MKPKFTFILLTAITILLTISPSIYACGISDYGSDNLTIERIVEKENGDIQIVFTPMAETMYYCPGAIAIVTENGLELIFVRTSIRKSPDVTYPAVIAGKDTLSKVITVRAKGQSVYWDQDKQIVKIFPKS